MSLRRLPALIALLAFVGANVAAVLHYGHHHQHRAVVLKDSPPAVPHCDCGHHAHAGLGGESDSQPARSPQPAGDDDCPICQSLANKPLLASTADLPAVAEPVSDAMVELPAVPRSGIRALPFSRGPPLA